MWSKEQLAYLAGIIDGEGTIFIQKHIKNGYTSYWPRFQISNTNRELMEWIKNTFGGLAYDKPRIKHNPKWRMQIQWYTTVSLMDKLLPLIIPYLIIKKPHAIIMIEFRNTFAKKFGSAGVNPEVLNFRIECMQKIKHLNNPI